MLHIEKERALHYNRIVLNMKKRLWNKPSVIKDKIEKLDYKLCKYFSIDDGVNSHSIQNLQLKTVHFSSPSIFNDPFDSNIGASFSESFGHKKTILDDKKKSIRISAIIKTCMSATESNEYIEFWKKCASWAESQKIVKIYILDVVRFALSNASSIKWLTKEKNNLQIFTLIDYLISDDCTEKYLDKTFLEDKECRLTVEDYDNATAASSRFFGKKHDKDSYYGAQKQLALIQKSINKVLIKTFKVACFCESHSNVLMWSHYAKNHTGFCVEYDFHDYFNDDFDKMLCPVSYSKRRTSVTAKLNRYIKIQGKKIESNFVYALDVLFSKSSIWSYEQEWRQAISLDKKDEREFNSKLRINRVFLGAKISHDNEIVIRKICDKNGITVVKMSLDDQFYALNEIV